jgi:RNA polymerase sigma-70 factor (ECF subfamily)
MMAHTALETPIADDAADVAQRQHRLYKNSVSVHGAAIDRLARAYEGDAERRRDLVQEIHVEIWRSFAAFDGRCSERTWIYRVAHNVGVSHVVREKRGRPQSQCSIEDLEIAPPTSEGDLDRVTDRRLGVDRLMALVRSLTPLDRQIILLYLEEIDANSIAEITGLTPGHVATKIHRIKNVLARQFEERASS